MLSQQKSSMQRNCTARLAVTISIYICNFGIINKCKRYFIAKIALKTCFYNIVYFHSIHNMADSIDRIKCGKIFMLSNRNFALICEFCCQEDFYTLEDFGGHIMEYHIAESDAEEYCISSDTDCEYIPLDINEDTKKNLAENLQNADGCNSLSIAPHDSLLIERDWVPPNSDNDDFSDDESIRSELSIRKQRRIKQRTDSKRIENIADATLQDGTQSTRISSKQLRTRKAINYNDDIRAEFSNDLSDLDETHQVSSTTKERSKISTKNRFECNLCHKFLRSKQRCLDHKNIHTGKRPYQCKHCSKTYPAKNALDTHVRAVHRKDFRHACSICGKRFIFPKLLDNHIRANHLPETDPNRYFPCNQCNGKCKSYSQLIYHKRKIHKIKSVATLSHTATRITGSKFKMILRQK